jgi:hypothetical protein
MAIHPYKSPAIHLFIYFYTVLAVSHGVFITLFSMLGTWFRTFSMEWTYEILGHKVPTYRLLNTDPISRSRIATALLRAGYALY